VEENAEQEYKQSVLDALEARWLAEKETQEESYYSSSYSSWLNYGTSIVTNVVENLQVIRKFSWKRDNSSSKL